MRQLKIFWLLSVGAAAAITLDVLPAKVAYAQEVRVLYPQEGQDVRGEVTARFEGIPQGGYAVVKIDGQFRQASAQDFVVLDTLADRVTFARGDGAYKMEVTVLNSGGKRVGTSTVNFNVANSKVDSAGKPVRLVHWSASDRNNGTVQRFRVFAESNATITEGTAASGGAAGGEGSATGGAPMSGMTMGGAPGGGRGGMAMGGAPAGRGGMAMGGGGATGGAAASGYVEAPLDFQVSALMRRILRDTNMLSGSANISTIVQEGFERQREGTGDAGGGAAMSGGATPSRGGGAAPSGGNGLGKAPWSQDGNGNALWNPAAETGKYFIKMIQPNGNEINATRKAPSLALADLLPTFPDVPVRPGSTWGTTMSFVGELSSRTPINVKDAPMTFTSYEDLQTPGGENRRCAKLESRFRLPDNLAKRIAATLANKTGGSGGAAAGGGDMGGLSVGGGSARGGGAAMGGGDAGGTLTESDIQVARTDVARVIWFDVERRRILRAEDTIRSNFEMPATADATGGGAVMGGATMGGGALGGAAGGAPVVPAEPGRVAYNLSITTWLDDRVPNPTGQYVPGGAGAHTRDSVAEPGLSRILRGNVPTP